MKLLVRTRPEFERHYDWGPADVKSDRCYGRSRYSIFTCLVFSDSVAFRRGMRSIDDKTYVEYNTGSTEFARRVGI